MHLKFVSLSLETNLSENHSPPTRNVKRKLCKLKITDATYNTEYIKLLFRTYATRMPICTAFKRSTNTCA